MPEALARVRHDPMLFGPKRADVRARAPVARGWWTRFLPKRAQDYAGLGLAATIAGIVANALVFQHERHPTPFFSANRPVSAIEARREPPATSDQPAAAPAEAPEVSPPPRPAGLQSASQSSTTVKSRDPIGSMLRAGVIKDQQRLVGVAQAALIKLGYSIKGGGALGADTLAALHEYQKAHGMPVSTEITPRVVKQLLAAANASASR